MDEQKALKEFQERIGYQFKDEKLLYEALSHSSFANENKKARNSNERLEFLGDSVLSIVVSDHIFEHYKHMPEGELTKMRASLVCEKALFEFSKKIELGKYIFLGKGYEITGCRERPSIFQTLLKQLSLQFILTVVSSLFQNIYFHSYLKISRLMELFSMITRLFFRR